MNSPFWKAWKAVSPLASARLTDLPETIATLKWHAEAADKIYDQMSPANANGIGMIVREPMGVAGCVLPWNFPLMMLAWKIGPALAMGNSVHCQARGTNFIDNPAYGLNWHWKQVYQPEC